MQCFTIGRYFWVERIAGTAGQCLWLGDCTKSGELGVQFRRRCPLCICPRFPLICQGGTKGVATGGVEAVGYPLVFDCFDEGYHAVSTVFLYQVFEKERSIGIPARATRPLGRVAACLADGLEPPFENGCPQNHFVECAMNAPGAGQCRFVPGGDAFDVPQRGGDRWEHRHSSEQLAKEAIATRAVYVEDVRQFMCDEVFQPVVEVSKAERVGRWAGVDDDSV